MFAGGGGRTESGGALQEEPVNGCTRHVSRTYCGTLLRRAVDRQNQTVSLGYTAVSLHTLSGDILGYSKPKVSTPGQFFIFGGGGVGLAILGYPNSKSQLLVNFSFWGVLLAVSYPNFLNPP